MRQRHGISNERLAPGKRHAVVIAVTRCRFLRSCKSRFCAFRTRQNVIRRRCEAKKKLTCPRIVCMLFHRRPRFASSPLPSARMRATRNAICMLSNRDHRGPHCENEHEAVRRSTCFGPDGLGADITRSSRRLGSAVSTSAASAFESADPLGD